jgi:hypothetical protein
MRPVNTGLRRVSFDVLLRALLAEERRIIRQQKGRTSKANRARIAHGVLAVGFGILEAGRLCYSPKSPRWN